ncbi:MAG: L-seryl-tRNA(Sec) selenium transferase [Planctomycetaceae bacterium]|nr:L-seryl-tRNA(Sec) selenium transferase [Planctomycetaceae bacterium]
MQENNQSLLRKIPSVDELLDFLSFPHVPVPRTIIVNAIRDSVNEFRVQLLKESDKKMSEEAIRELIVSAAKERIEKAMKPFYRKVINATGIILHTGVGRAILPRQAIEQITNELGGYSLLQMDLETGERSKRDNCIERLLQQLTGTQAATVVNNNAAATAIVLNTLGCGKEVIVSRGQLVEIGGSFRLPDVMASSGVKLVEVGTTNKTHLRDYKNAITENTAAIMRVHPSNYKITGFTSEVPLDELVSLAHEHKLPLIDDVGAGALIDFSKFGFEYEPTLADSIRAGADVVTSSGDKLIGASQAGIILGKSEYINAIRKNPFARIVRVDKITLVALEATLKLFLDESFALKEVPTLAMLQRSIEELNKQARNIESELKLRNCDAEIEVVDGFSQMGSGSLPSQNLKTKLVAVKPKKIGIDVFAKRLRMYEPPIIGRIQNNQFLMDSRTLLEDDEKIIVEAVSKILAP